MQPKKEGGAAAQDRTGWKKVRGLVYAPLGARKSKSSSEVKAK